MEAAGPVADQAQIPVYSPANTSEFIGIESYYIFYGALKNEQKITPLVDWLKDREIEKVAIVVDSTSWGENHLDVFTQAARLAGADIIFSEKILWGTETETIPTIVTMLGSSEAEVLLWTGGDTMASILFKRMYEQKISVPVVGTVHLQNVIDRGLVEKSANQDMYVFTTEINEKFADRFREEYGETPGLYADSAYDGLMLLVEAIQNTDGTGYAVAKYLHEDTNYSGISKTYNFNEDGDIHGGEWLLVPVE